jgi:hypothetical protein
VIEKTNDMRLEDKSTEDVDAKVSMGANWALRWSLTFLIESLCLEYAC